MSRTACAAPATVATPAGCLAGAGHPDPVIIFEHARLYNLEASRWLRRPSPSIITRASAARGPQVTIVTYGGSLPRSLEAAPALAAEGIEAEVIDLRVLRPLDEATIMGSVRPHASGRSSWTRPGAVVGAAEVMAPESWSRRSTARRAGGARLREEVPIPYASHMEEAALPSVAERSPRP